MNPFLRKFSEGDFPKKKRLYVSARGALRDMRALDPTTQALEISETYLQRRIDFMVGTMKEGAK
jgi:hypothetical protein